jgi:cobalt/nickel transport system ATP-binding protein
MEPQVLVLDEPTAGLDPQGVADLMAFVNRLPEDYGMTVIFSTHQVDLVAEMADFVYVMDRGQIVASGTVEEIFDRPEMLAQTRLDVPVIPKLIRSLQENGVAIDMAYTYEDAQKSFLDAYTRRT